MNIFYNVGCLYNVSVDPQDIYVNTYHEFTIDIMLLWSYLGGSFFFTGRNSDHPHDLKDSTKSQC